MSDEAALQLLLTNDFLQGLSQSHLRQLSDKARVVEFPAHATIFEEYQPAKNVYFVAAGQISLGICDSQGCRQISDVGPGELIGWSPLIGRTRLFDTATARTKVRAIEIDGEELIGFCRANPEFGFEFMQRAAAVLGERLSAARIQLSGFQMPTQQLDSD